MEDLSTITIDITSKDGREVVEKLISAADVPAGLVGRAKNGSAVLRFRSTHPLRTIPHVGGAAHHQREFQLASKDGLVRLTIATEAAPPAAGLKWDREIPHYQLPTLGLTAADVGERIIGAAFALDLTWASIVDMDLAQEARAAKLREDIAAGRVKVKTEAELEEDYQAKRDAETVRDTAGREYEWSDGPAAQMVLAARARHKMRLEKASESAAAA